MKRHSIFILCSLILLAVNSVNSFAQDFEWLMKMKSVNILRDNRDRIREIFGKPILIEEDETSLICQKENLL